jgi:uncharacterized peroxidase-related enzyme
MARIKPLDVEELDPMLQSSVDAYLKRGGHVANSFRTMARRPKVAKAYDDLRNALMESLTIPVTLRNLMFHIMSYEAGCRYCQAHSITSISKDPDVSPEKLEALWEYDSSPLYSDAERAALRFAQASAAVPNAVTDEDFEALKEFFTDDQIVEIVAVLSVGAFINRWNDTMGSELEESPRAMAEKLLGAKGWELGKHAG